MAEVYGQPWLETARDKVIALMDALVVSMASGYDPKLSYVYDRHNTAALRVNSVSVNLDSVDGDHLGVNRYDYLIAMSLRVHTDYEGGVVDGLAIARLMNSVINKLHNNYDLGDGYKMQGVTEILNNQIFTDSATIGGEIKAQILISIQHTQE